MKEGQALVALAGNPNVGKSTLFNSLTGMHQHTGNWAGKTVALAEGECQSGAFRYRVVDIPGAYSLMTDSAEEEMARDYICFGEADVVVLVCDGSCLERNMDLVLQTLELGRRTLVCVNLLDEASRRRIQVDRKRLEQRLGVPVVGTVAGRRDSREALVRALKDTMSRPAPEPFVVPYPAAVEEAVARLLPLAEAAAGDRLPARWLCLRLLDGEEGLLRQTDAFLEGKLRRAEELLAAAEEEREELYRRGFSREALLDGETAAVIRTGEDICREAVHYGEGRYSRRDRQIDRFTTGRIWAWPLMLLLLALVLYLTIVGANAVSDRLAVPLMAVQGLLARGLSALDAPPWLQGLLVDGAYRVLAWVVSVMLPPMAIFFPLFTLLEDAGYLPRVAYNLDRPFQRCRACGKQALTMCMGLGCNAAGVVGCRIIDSRRDRLLAILTNSLVPCNGRFPLLLALLSMFFAGKQGSLQTALLLTGVIVLSVVLSLLATRLLSATVLRGMPSSFVLELPPYRRPHVGKVLVRSLLDRTLSVLGRAAAVAAPAGALIWLLANSQWGGVSLLHRCAAALDPMGRFFGMDGAILLAFLLGLPANETVLPILVMIYTAQSSLSEPGTLAVLHPLLLSHGWTTLTALCVLLFTLLHWPCSTTLWTVKKETGSWKWAGLAALLPTAMGLSLCALLAALARLTGLA